MDVSQRLASIETRFVGSTVQSAQYDDNDLTTVREMQNHMLGGSEASQDVPYNARDSLETKRVNDATNIAECRTHEEKRPSDTIEHPRRAQFDIKLESELYTSKVYTRTTHRHAMSSLLSRPSSVAGMSFFSGVSLAQISNISIIALPVFYNEVWNQQNYRNPKEHKIDFGLSKRVASSSEFLNRVLSVKSEDRSLTANKVSNPLQLKSGSLIKRKIGTRFKFSTAKSSREAGIEQDIISWAKLRRIAKTGQEMQKVTEEDNRRVKTLLLGKFL